jgi:hypothetical protein
MRKTYILTLSLLIIFVALVSLACSLTGGGDPTATSVPETEEEVVVQDPIETEPPAPEPTETQETLPPETEEPTETEEEVETEEVVDEPPAWFTEEFDGDMDNWSYFLMSGSEMNMDLYADVDSLVFDLRGENQWVYVLYDPYYYSDVVIEAFAENKGKNTNNVSLICNYTDEYGWYEFNITNGGMYDILIYDEIEGEYQTLTSGGSVHVNTGRDSNVYTAVCMGNQLALYINGFLEKEHTDTIYNLDEGQVGISVSSFDVLPILVEIEYFDISSAY